MKIIYIASSIIPSRWANSFHVMKMCQAFRQLGHDVELLIPFAKNYLNGREEIDIWQHYGLTERFPLTRFKASNLLRLGYDFALRAASFAIKEQPDLILSRFIQAATLTSWKGLPTILEYHAPIETPLSREVLRRLREPRGVRQLILTSLDHMSFQGVIHGSGFRKLIVISQVLKGRFLEYAKGALREDSIDVCPDGVDLERFQNLPQPVEARRLVGLPEDTLTFGYVGHLYEGFGIEIILELARRLPQANFLIVGGEDEHVANYVRRAKALGLPNVRFLGFLPNAVLPRYFAACDILLMPYQKVATMAGEGNTAQWMSPMKMFEYMATGRLILSSDLPVLREVLNETNAVLCKPEDVEFWQQMAERAGREPVWRRMLGKQAQTDVTQYGWAQRVSRILEGLHQGAR